MKLYGKVTKTEALLLALTAVFLCVLAGLARRDRLAAAQDVPVSVVTEHVTQGAAVPPPLDLNTATEAELMERVEAGDYDCAVLSLPADFAGPGRALETAAALGRVGDEALHSLLSEARQNDGKADSLYTEAEQLFLDSGAFIPLMTASFTLQTGGFPAVSLANGAISFSRG